MACVYLNHLRVCEHVIEKNGFGRNCLIYCIWFNILDIAVFFHQVINSKSGMTVYDGLAFKPCPPFEPCWIVQTIKVLKTAIVDTFFREPDGNYCNMFVFIQWF